MTPQEHNRTLGILFLVYLGIQAVGMVIAIGVMSVTFGSLLATSPDDTALPVGIITVIFIIVFLFSTLMLLPAGVAGYRMLKGKPNSRNWGIAASIIALLNMPLGTILGVYGLWFLFGEAGKAYYLGVDSPSMMPPPPPHSWQ